MPDTWHSFSPSILFIVIQGSIRILFCTFVEQAPQIVYLGAVKEILSGLNRVVLSLLKTTLHFHVLGINPAGALATPLLGLSCIQGAAHPLSLPLSVAEETGI